MFILTNKQMNEPGLVNALQELSREKMPAKAAWNITRLVRKIEVAVKDGRDTYKTIIKKYVKHNDKDYPVMAMQDVIVKKEDGTEETKKEPTGNFEFLEGASEEEMKKEIAELLKIEVQIESDKIKLNDLDGLSLSAQHLFALENLIEEPVSEKIPSDEVNNVVPLK